MLFPQLSLILSWADPSPRHVVCEHNVAVSIYESSADNKLQEEKVYTEG